MYRHRCFFLCEDEFLVPWHMEDRNLCSPASALTFFGASYAACVQTARRNHIPKMLGPCRKASEATCLKARMVSTSFHKDKKRDLPFIQKF